MEQWKWSASSQFPRDLTGLWGSRRTSRRFQSVFFVNLELFCMKEELSGLSGPVTDQHKDRVKVGECDFIIRCSL